LEEKSFAPSTSGDGYLKAICDCIAHHTCKSPKAKGKVKQPQKQTKVNKIKVHGVFALHVACSGFCFSFGLLNCCVVGFGFVCCPWMGSRD
jgi:hypothetical protein